MAKITGLTPEDRRRIRAVVQESLQVWPGFHGTAAPQEDIHAAIEFIRSRVQRLGISGAVAALRYDNAQFKEG